MARGTVLAHVADDPGVLAGVVEDGFGVIEDCLVGDGGVLEDVLYLVRGLLELQHHGFELLSGFLDGFHHFQEPIDYDHADIIFGGLVDGCY